MKDVLDELANIAGGTLLEVSGPLPDGSRFAVMSMPLPEDHWIYGDSSMENHSSGGEVSWSFEPPPMPMRMGTDNPHRTVYVDMLHVAGRYAVRSATLKGKDMDFDPDALIQNLIVGFLGYHTPDGLSDDEWANPRGSGNAGHSEENPYDEHQLNQKMIDTNLL